MPHSRTRQEAFRGPRVRASARQPSTLLDLGSFLCEKRPCRLPGAEPLALRQDPPTWHLRPVPGVPSVSVSYAAVTNDPKPGGSKQRFLQRGCPTPLLWVHWPPRAPGRWPPGPMLPSGPPGPFLLLVQGLGVGLRAGVRRGDPAWGPPLSQRPAGTEGGPRRPAPLSHAPAGRPALRPRRHGVLQHVHGAVGRAAPGVLEAHARHAGLPLGLLRLRGHGGEASAPVRRLGPHHGREPHHRRGRAPLPPQEPGAPHAGGLRGHPDDGGRGHHVPAVRHPVPRHHGRAGVPVGERRAGGLGLPHRQPHGLRGEPRRHPHPFPGLRGPGPRPDQMGDAPDTDRVRGRLHPQGVCLPVRQLLLLAHLRCLLQGQVCGVPRQLPHLVWSPQRGVRGRGLPDGAGAGAPGHHGGQAGHQQRAGDPRPEAQGLVAEVAAAPQEEGGGGPGALGGRLPAAALRGPVRGVPGNGAAVRLRHGLRGRLPARAALRAAQQLGRAAPGRAQVRLRVPAPGGRARPGHRHLVPRPRGHHAPGGRQQRGARNQPWDLPRYRAFRDDDGHYSQTYWTLLAIRLAFVIVFEVCGGPPAPLGPHGVAPPCRLPTRHGQTGGAASWHFLLWHRAHVLSQAQAAGHPWAMQGQVVPGPRSPLFCTAQSSPVHSWSRCHSRACLGRGCEAPCSQPSHLACLQHVVFSVGRVLDLLVPDVPESVEIKVKREYYLAKQALAENEPLFGTDGAKDGRPLGPEASPGPQA
ncbi:anoctamin-7 isoform X9 [Dasypus novemcinctus]|uniref:anoctamin-7 isoform X9 n=1 Tax=Dasypus novemcinctus TaxID=9361 RepID=UPI00265E4FF3|nr:anoctamin-7 isoform X9 [Dasypus novemcinctus]